MSISGGENAATATKWKDPAAQFREKKKTNGTVGPEGGKIEQVLVGEKKNCGRGKLSPPLGTQ